MASKRRGGFKPPELRGTLGTLLRTTTDAVRGALERGAREGRARFDDLRTNRRRHDALAELGEIVLDLVRRGEVDLAELPEARDLIRELNALDARDSDSDGEPAVHAATRRRFDDRGPTTATDTDDGTTSSGAVARSARPTVPDRPRSETASSRAPTRPMKSMWRPLIDDAPPMPDRGRSERPTEPDRLVSRAPAGKAEPPAERAGSPPERDRSWLPTRDPDRKGGIRFDEDDLADYMHPDDVPPKPPPREPGDGDP